MNQAAVLRTDGVGDKSTKFFSDVFRVPGKEFILVPNGMALTHQSKKTGLPQVSHAKDYCLQ